MAKKRAGTDPSLHVERSNESVLHVTLAPGAEMAPHRHDKPYVVVPLRNAALTRITRKGNKVVDEAAIAHRRFVPYHVDATPPGHTISIRNDGPSFSTFQKIVRHPDPTPSRPQPRLPTEKLAIFAGGERHLFTVEMATTIAEQMAGLMFRKSVARRGGMLFDWGRPRAVSMWMENVLIPLDIAFITEGGVIHAVAASQAPGSLQAIPSDGPVRATLELAGGTLAEIGAGPGDRVGGGIFKA
jgi:uncharacterized protein